MSTTTRSSRCLIEGFKASTSSGEAISSRKRVALRGQEEGKERGNERTLQGLLLYMFKSLSYIHSITFNVVSRLICAGGIHASKRR